jgi:GSCFA family
VTDHPYMNLPSHCFWRRIHNVESIDEVDPVVAVPFRIGKSEGIATAGSCFAQHIARHLSASGYNYMVTEEAHPLVPPEVAREHNYGVFTARYGNLYTARQLLQLFKRAYGLFHPLDNVWVNKEGRFLDPYRPTIEPKGFGSRREFEIDRERHFAAVREAFEESNVFIFTFGLTETYINAQDGMPGGGGWRIQSAKTRLQELHVAGNHGGFPGVRRPDALQERAGEVYHHRFAGAAGRDGRTSEIGY